jgi:hypothetical protein
MKVDVVDAIEESQIVRFLEFDLVLNGFRVGVDDEFLLLLIETVEENISNGLAKELVSVGAKVEADLPRGMNEMILF